MKSAEPSSPEVFDWVQTDPLVRRRVLQVGEKSMLVSVVFKPGAITAIHSHAHEQLTYVARGRLRMNVDGVEHMLETGDSILLRGDVPHGATADVETMLLDTFSPPRQDILDHDRKARDVH